MRQLFVNLSTGSSKEDLRKYEKKSLVKNDNVRTIMDFFLKIFVFFIHLPFPSVNLSLHTFIDNFFVSPFNVDLTFSVLLTTSRLFIKIKIKLKEILNCFFFS